MPNPNWMSRNWLVIWGDPQNSNLLLTDTVSFASTTLNFWHNIPGVTPSVQPWGTLDTITATGAIGNTNPENTPFQITYDATQDQLTCTMGTPPSGLHWGSIVLGAFAGALAGTVAGVVAGSLLKGFLTGLVAGSTGSFVAARQIEPETGQGGPTITWVANDGGPGSIPKAIPQAVPPVKATA
jgi:uncharacterized membrane protein YeaQ/YmgE (transglycosylase-associated protein family)